MIGKDEWDDAADEWARAERERLGGPPSADEVVSYQRGELSATDAARVRALLVYYPELTALLTESEPEPATGELSEFDLARDRAALRRRIGPTRPFPFRVLGEVAAGVTIALLGGFLVHSHSQNREPYIQARYEMRNFLTRGGPPEAAPFKLPPAEDRYLLSLTMAKRYGYADYRIDIVNVTPSGPKTLRTLSAVTPLNGTFEVSVPRELLALDNPRIDINGVENGQVHLLESFPIRMANR